MRRFPALIAVLGLAAAVLVGCSSSPTASSCQAPADTDPATMGLITVTGSADATPAVSVRTPFHTSTTQFKTVTKGTGDVPITRDSQLLVLDLTLSDGTTGRPLVKTSYDGDLSRVYPVSQWTKTIGLTGVRAALQCATAGARIAVALAPKDVHADTLQGLGVSTDDSLIAVLDVRKVYLPAANGALVYNQGWGLPDVVRAPDGRPGVVVPDGPAPKNMTVQVLKRGSGQVVNGDAPVRVHETVVNWTDKTVASTTWDSTPVSLTLSSQPKGVQDALKGQTVGSQIMAIIPPADDTSGAQDTQIYVFDILGIDAPGTTATQ